MSFEEQFAANNFSAYDGLKWQMGVTNTHIAINDGLSLVTAATTPEASAAKADFSATAWIVVSNLAKRPLEARGNS